MKKKLGIFMLVLGLFLGLTACGKTETEEPATEAEEVIEAGEETEVAEEKTDGKKEVIKIGTNGPHLDMMEKAKEVIDSTTDYEAELVVFDDVIQPNVALAEGSVDMNFFQHMPYLQAYNEQHGTNLQPYADKGVFMLQFGLYSNKYKSIDEFQDGDQITFSMDPSNRAIALKFLEELGMIKLEEGVETPDITNVAENPKNLQFTEVDVTAVVNSIEDPEVAGGIVMGFAMARSGKDPSTALAYASEALTGHYMNVLAVREEDKDSEKAKAVFEVLRGPEMAEFYDEYFKGAVKLITD